MRYARTNYGITKVLPNKVILNDVKKVKSNIVDLLEQGDIIKLKDVKNYQEVLCIDEEKLYLSEYIYMSGLQKFKKDIEKDIEWVITHEQIEREKFEVGD